MHPPKLLATAIAAVTALSLAAPAQAQFGMDRKQPKNAATPELPRCATPVGTVSIKEPENRWWTELGLSNPETLIKLMASRSGCLRVVDRNGGLAMRGVERDLSASGEMQRGSNIGKGQVKAADYILVPDIVNSDSNTGGANIGGLVGSFVPGGAGALLGGLRTKRAQAQALLTLVDARTTEQVYVAEGTAQKTNIGFAAGGGAFGTTGIGALAGGGYSDTDIGKVITAAYFNAFVDLIGYLQGSQPGEAAAAAPTQAYSATQSVVMRASPSAGGKAIRTFAVGDLVYPTGQKNGVWWEVDDENGNRGWTPSTMISPRN
jgi:curli biogenesis system outer membrane secretion channel CsgG